jgi:hypothetical protein
MCKVVDKQEEHLASQAAKSDAKAEAARKATEAAREARFTDHGFFPGATVETKDEHGLDVLSFA